MEIPSKANITERTAYLNEDFQIKSNKIIPFEPCTEGKHLKQMTNQEETIAELRNSKCLDLSGAQLSGGTNPNKELLERRVVLKYEYCGNYQPTTRFEGCASESEFAAFFSNSTFTMQIADNYIDFAEKESHNAVRSRLYNIGTTPISGIENQFFNGQFLMTTTESTFDDKWYQIGLFGGDTVKKNFMEYDRFISW